MYLNLSPADAEKVKGLLEIRQQNNDICWMLCDYLNNHPRFITKDLMTQVNRDFTLADETAYFALLTGILDIEPETNERDMQLANTYLRPAIKKLNPKTYRENPYYRKIQIPEVKLGDWELKYESYQAYEAFIYNDLILKPDFREIPRVGFFDEEFWFPAVKQNDREWMSIKPNEIETMQPALNEIKGRVITFGLGLGYFTYMASIKENIQQITVVERDSEVIQLFEKYILPQFQYKEKVKIISVDAFEFAEQQMPYRKYDYAFVDLWHDESDGLDLYLKMKKMEPLNPCTHFLYWIEDSLISGFRWRLIDWVIRNARSYHEIEKWLSKSFLQRLAATKTRSAVEA